MAINLVKGQKISLAKDDGGHLCRGQLRSSARRRASAQLLRRSKLGRHNRKRLF